MEHAIGETLILSHIYDRTKVKIVEGGDDCSGCIFVLYEGLDCLGYCNGKHRRDHKNIIYKEIKEE